MNNGCSLNIWLIKSVQCQKASKHYFSVVVLKRPKKSVFEMLNDKNRSWLGKKSNFCGISGHGMFKSIKYLGHIHYACPTVGMTDKKDRFQS